MVWHRLKGILGDIDWVKVVNWHCFHVKTVIKLLHSTDERPIFISFRSEPHQYNPAFAIPLVVEVLLSSGAPYKLQQLFCSGLSILFSNWLGSQNTNV
ncbi:hypothetical protein TMatcc_004965 [Talaromyces marneffei ATCC 18224]